MNWVNEARQALDQGKPCILVTVIDIRGSAPREAGVKMAVFEDTIYGTIGGGTLELRAMAHARAKISDGTLAPETEQWILGPDLGQCCGGKVDVTFELLNGAVLQRLAQELVVEYKDLPQVAIFGAGHVGLALVRALLPLPFQITCIDDREERLPHADGRVVPILSENPECKVAALPNGTFVFVMTHSHDLDYKVCHATLKRRDFPFVGLIGSATKRARFLQRFKADGLSEVDLQNFVCPIGLDSISGKTPAVIATSAAAQLLQVSEAEQAKLQNSASSSLHVVGAGK